MKSIKKGRGPSIMGGVVALLMAVLGIVWSVGASKIGSSPFGGGGFNMEGSPFSFSGGTGTIFTVFGVYPCVRGYGHLRVYQRHQAKPFF